MTFRVPPPATTTLGLAVLLLLPVVVGCHSDTSMLICTGEVVKENSVVEPGVYGGNETKPSVPESDLVLVEEISFTVEQDDSADHPKLSPAQIRIETKKVGDGLRWLTTLVFPSRPLRVVASAPGCEQVRWDFNPETAEGQFMIDWDVRTFILKQKGR